LPVKETFMDGNNICLTDVEDEKENNKKKEKELFSLSNSYFELKDSYNITYKVFTFKAHALLHTVETPPPDFS
jgi:hypothetical protein